MKLEKTRGAYSDDEDEDRKPKVFYDKKLKKQIEIKFPAKTRWRRKRETINIPYYPDSDSDD